MQVLRLGTLVALAGIAQAQVAGYGQCMYHLAVLKYDIIRLKLISEQAEEADIQEVLLVPLDLLVYRRMPVCSPHKQSKINTTDV